MDTKSISLGLAVKIMILGFVLSAFILAAQLIGNLWAAVGLAVVGAVGTVVVARALEAPFAGMAKALGVIHDRNREFLYPEAESLKRFGPLGELASEVVVFNFRRREYYRSAIHNMGAALFLCDDKTRITHASEALYEFLRRPEKDVLGQSVGRAVYGSEGGTVTEEVIRTGKKVVVNKPLKLWDGRTVESHVFVDCVKTAKGDILGAVMTLLDMTETRAQQRQIESTREEMYRLGMSINELAQRVASASEELSASADEQARGAQHQKGQADSVATAMEEMTATVMEVAKNASQTSESATEANTSAESGASQVDEAVAGINRVADSTGRLGQVLSQLDGQAAEIGRIISVINDIADQTNLLALNAAIEAARAGEAGRGFAVVADEVRKLAEKTMTATKEVENSIRQIQDGSRHAVSSMKDTEDQVQHGTRSTAAAGEALREIMGRIREMTSQVAQIATAAEEQSAAAEEINRSIEDIAHVAAEADEGASQTAQATRELAELAQQLLALSSRFSGEESDASKLRSSKSEMKGILPKLMSEFIRQKFGQSVYDKMYEEMGRPTFLPNQSYPDQVLAQMADIAAGLTGKTQRDIFVDLGRYTVPQFNKMYKRYFKTKDLKEFYLTMNDTHARLTKDYPGIHPPRFTYEDKGDTLVMTYHSRRGYQHYFEGILRGAAEFLNQPADIKVTRLNDDTARAEIRFTAGSRKPRALA